ncbi:MAG: DUF3108 domain-containing protein [Nitrospiraceae bacterium]|nr:DUF3108 domain-containing protein [Nitrospiraceae bacterium]
MGSRQRRRPSIVAFSFYVLAVFVTPAFSAVPGAHAFRIPERLVYDLTWSGIKTGTATLEIGEKEGSARIVSTARSVPWVSFFYTVNDRIESEFSRPGRGTLGKPLRYRVSIREGRYRREKEIAFDKSGRKAVYTDHLSGERKEIAVAARVFDPLSSFYYFRTVKAEPGKSVYVPVVDGGKVWNVEVRVIRKERVSTKLGDFDTIVIRPLLKSEGIFNRSGDMVIWLTDDEKRIPVQMKTKVALGRVTATLTGGKY